MKVRPGVKAFGLTDVGCQRENNEDTFAYWEAEDDATFTRLGRLAIVADGMGGTEGGQFASRIATDTVRDVYSSSTSNAPQEILTQALIQANADVQQKARTTPALRGMGTTLTAAAVVGDKIYFAHVGDSRLYLVRKESIRPLTRDHSLVGRLVESGVIRAVDADSHPQRHVLTAAVGVSETIEPDTPAEPVTLSKGDLLLLCTDGLWGQVSEPEILRAVSLDEIEDAARTLVQLARDHGGPDNITVQILKIF
jgi:PPM family protein phosphatase